MGMDKAREMRFMRKIFVSLLVSCFIIIVQNIGAYQPIVTLGKPPLEDIQYSPDGRFLATLTSSFVELLDAETMKPLSRIYTPELYCNQLEFSPDSSLFAVCNKDIYIYNVATNELYASITSENYKKMDFSPDGKYLAYSEKDTVYLWDIRQKKVIRELTGDPNPLLPNSGWYDIQTIKFHPAGNLLAVGSFRQTVALWNVETGKIESYLDTEYENPPIEIKFSNGGKLLAIRTGMLIYLFNTSGGIRNYLSGFEVDSIAFTNDDSYLLIGESRGELRIFNIETEKDETRLAVNRSIPENQGYCEIRQIAISPDGQKFASLLSYTRIAIWETKDFSKINTLHGWGMSYPKAIYLPKMNRIVTGAFSDLCFWDATTGELVKTIEFYYDVECITASPDGRHFAVCAEQTDRVYDGSTGREIYKFDDRHGHSRVMTYSPSGRYLASNGWKGTYIYDTHTGKMFSYVYDGWTGNFIMNDWVQAAILLFTPDEKEIIIMPREKNVTEFWNIETGKLDFEKSYKGPLIKYGNDFLQARGKGYGIEILMANSRKRLSYIDAQMPDEWYWDKVFHPSGNIMSIFTYQERGNSKCDFYNTWTGNKITTISNIFDVQLIENDYMFVVDKSGLELYRISDVLGVNPNDVRGGNLPAQFAQIKNELLPNYPNPFNPETWIPYQLESDADVVIKIHSITGQLIKTLSLGRKEAGIYSDKNKSAYWDGKDNYGESVGSGLYFCTIQAGDFVATRKMIMLK
jgi:WD40 repeat protein